MDIHGFWHMLVRRVVEDLNEDEATDKHVIVVDHVEGGTDATTPREVEKSIRWVCMRPARGIEQCVDCKRYCEKNGIRSMIVRTY